MQDSITSVFALRKVAPRAGVEFQWVQMPQGGGADDVVIAVEAAGICGTDLHIADWTSGYESMAACMPVTLGHEFCGRVLEGPDHLRGKRIVGRPSVVCGQCAGCQNEPENKCSNRHGIGIHRDGAFAPYACLPVRNCVVVSQTLDSELAALTEPMTVAMQAVARGGNPVDKDVLVVGPGPIGLGAALFARRAGACRIVIVGRSDAARLACARSMGFDQRVDMAILSTSLDQMEKTIGLFDIIIEATGVPEVASQSQHLLKPGGTLVICGIHAKPAAIDLTRLVRMEQTLVGSYRAPVAAWPKVIKAIQSDGDTFRKLITHRLPLASALEGLDLMRRRQAVKVILKP